MKKKELIILSILVTLAVAAVVGLCIYLNAPVQDPEYGIRIEASDVSSTGLKLHVERERGDGASPVMWSEYAIQKWTNLGWEPVELDPLYLYTNNRMEKVTIPNGFSHTLEVNWQKACGKLSTGLYRILKEVGRGKNTQTCYAPFFVINWWEVLFEIIGMAVIIVVIYMVIQKGFWVKLKRISLILLVAASVVGIAGFVIYLKVPVRDSEWGISLRVKESSPAGITYELTRDDEIKDWNLSAGSDIYFERYTLRGWEYVNMRLPHTAEGYDVSHDFSKEWVVDWNYYNGKLPAGLYRAVKVVTVEEYYEDGFDGLLVQLYRAPFVVASRWEIVLLIVTMLILGLIICLQTRFRILNRLWKYASATKRRRRIVLGSVVTVAVLVWLISVFFIGTLSSAWYRYEVTINEVTAEKVEGTIQYNDDGNEETKLLLKLKYGYCLEKRTLIGWKKLEEIPHAGAEAVSVREGKSTKFDFKWNTEYAILPKGTYRIKQPFEVWQKSEERTQSGNMYITFTIE